MTIFKFMKLKTASTQRLNEVFILYDNHSHSMLVSLKNINLTVLLRDRSELKLNNIFKIEHLNQYLLNK